MSCTLVGIGDGRKLAVGEFGDPAGTPVLFFHGALASWRYRHPDDRIAVDLGIRLLTAARPGFGESTRAPGRTVASWTTDVAALADALGIERFGVLGHSGGGPYALACGALLPDRVTTVGLAGSLAPFVTEERFVALGPMAQVLFESARGPVADLEPRLEALMPFFTSDVEAMVRSSFAGEPIPDVPGLIETFALDVTDVFAQGAAGWADELHALVHDWQFAISDVTVPTILWYGEDDPLRAGHGAALAHELGAEVHVHAGGHLAFFDVWAEALGGIGGADS